MPALLIPVISLHVLAAVFWAGTSFTLARTGGLRAENLFRPQLGAAGFAIVTGIYLWHLLHEGGFGASEQMLGVGALAALAAVAAQALLGGSAIRRLGTGPSAQAAARARLALTQRIAAGLLAVALVCMTGARFV